jgi:hypothetical protein
MVTLTRAPRTDGDATGPGRPPQGWIARHRALLLVLAVVVGVGAGGVAYVLLGAPQDTVVNTGPPVRHSSHTTARTASAGASAGAVPSASPGASVSAAVPGAPAAPGATGRNPFGGLSGGAVASTGPAGSTATGSAAAPTGAGAGAGTGTGATTPVTAPTTVTVTVTAPSIYLGLYGWTGDGRPMFWVNDTSSTPATGGTIATGLVYKGSFTSKSLKCANITAAGVSKSLCEGEVLKLG